MLSRCYIEVFTFATTILKLECLLLTEPQGISGKNSEMP